MIYEKIDRRKKYYLILDTETAGGLDNPQIYNIAFQVVDKKGKIYEEDNYIIQENFFNKNIMQRAYYYSKMPFYYEELKNNNIMVANIPFIRYRLNQIILKYNCEVFAYNSSFDAFALELLFNKESKIYMYDLYNMFYSFVEKYKNIKYTAFCNKYNFKDKKGKNRHTAEIAYRYISMQYDFIESHTALEDVKIEVQILLYLLKQKKGLDKSQKIKKRKFKKVLDK